MRASHRSIVCPAHNEPNSQERGFVSTFAHNCDDYSDEQESTGADPEWSVEKRGEPRTESDSRRR